MIVLKEHQAELFLKKEGFKIADYHLIKDISELKKLSNKLKYPVVLKNIDLLHKSDKNGVMLNVNKDNLISSYKKLNSNSILVQKQIDGLQLLIGIKKDLVFGHVLAFGSGGIYTEIIKDISFKILPITKKDIKDLISETKISKLLNYRNNKINKNKLESILLKFNNLIKKHQNIKELDINPLIANNKEILIADARIIFD